MKSDLFSGRWRLTQVDGVADLPVDEPLGFLGLTAGGFDYRVANVVQGTCQLAEDERLMCVEETATAVMPTGWRAEVEKAVGDALRSRPIVALVSGQLVLTTEDGRQLVFERS